MGFADTDGDCAGDRLLIWFVIRRPKGDAERWHLLALFVATIAAIIGKAMPIGALAMLAIARGADRVTSDKRPPHRRRAEQLREPTDLAHRWRSRSRGLIKPLGARIGYDHRAGGSTRWASATRWPRPS
jgi:DASS family divalent anion:Na+ symporter